MFLKLEAGGLEVQCVVHLSPRSRSLVLIPACQTKDLGCVSTEVLDMATPVIAAMNKFRDVQRCLKAFRTSRNGVSNTQMSRRTNTCTA